MTFIFKVSSFLCLLAAFIWQIGTETQWVNGNHVEEEEKKLNIVFGNVSFKTTPPPSDDDVTTKEPHRRELTTETGITVLLESIKDVNITEVDDLREDAIKSDASPENSVDREISNESDFFKDISKSETSSFLDDVKESSTEFQAGVISKTLLPDTLFSTEDDLETFQVTSCSENDPRCKTVLHVEEEHIVSPIPEYKSTLITSSNTISPSASTPLWNVVKSAKQQNEVTLLSPITSFKPLKSTSVSNTLSTITERSTTVQTSENLIPVERTMINKIDPVIDSPTINKTERSKSSKQNETPDDRGERIFSKISTTSPVTVITKLDVSEGNPEPTTLISKMLEAINATTDFSHSYFTTDIYTHTKSSEIHVEPSPKYDFSEKELFTISSVQQHFGMTTDPVISAWLSTTSWNGNKGRISYVDEKNYTETTTHLLPSFHQSSSVTEIIKQVTTTSSQTKFLITASPALIDPLPKYSTSTLQPQVNNRYAPKNITPIIATDKEEYIPPPRWTNPGCPSLPVCIEVTLVDTTWSEFCSQAREFQEFVAKAVSHYVHSVHPHQIVLEAENCVQNPSVYPVQLSSDVTIALFVTDDSGEYAERLTELCALILRKWAPTSFRNSVLEIKLFNAELQSTSLPVIPELTSGFVAAVSISAVAGVALCMLCILLVVMKQKLLQSRNSETTSPAADAYSLDSLSINASFRRRKNRKSARSYLNHAFSDQEIPSHPLNEKSLQNCLKNRELLEEEFKKVPMNMPKLNEIPEGAHVKNRYSNILPRPESRVVLSDPSGDPIKCYINANYVKGYAGKAATYIACQAPLPEGIEDFWRMVWEQQCRVIIMLTMFEENGTSRCAVYFPQSTLVSHPPYGDFQVSLLKKDVYEFYTMSTLRLLDIEKNLFRDIVHLWYTNWPDVGVPKDPSCLITFVQQCRSFINCNAGPTVVHCSTGTGRTGVFLVLDICMREYDESRSIDILQCVSQLRRDRGGAVQNKQQYVLIHEAILEYITRMANQSQRSSIQSC